MCDFTHTLPSIWSLFIPDAFVWQVLLIMFPVLGIHSYITRVRFIEPIGERVVTLGCLVAFVAAWMGATVTGQMATRWDSLTNDWALAQYHQLPSRCVLVIDRAFQHSSSTEHLLSTLDILCLVVAGVLTVLLVYLLFVRLHDRVQVN